MNFLNRILVFLIIFLTILPRAYSFCIEYKSGRISQCNFEEDGNQINSNVGLPDVISEENEKTNSILREMKRNKGNISLEAQKDLDRMDRELEEKMLLIKEMRRAREDLDNASLSLYQKIAQKNEESRKIEKEKEKLEEARKKIVEKRLSKYKVIDRDIEIGKFNLLDYDDDLYFEKDYTIEKIENAYFEKIARIKYYKREGKDLYKVKIGELNRIVSILDREGLGNNEVKKEIQDLIKQSKEEYDTDELSALKIYEKAEDLTDILVEDIYDLDFTGDVSPLLESGYNFKSQDQEFLEKVSPLYETIIKNTGSPLNSEVTNESLREMGLKALIYADRAHLAKNELKENMAIKIAKGLVDALLGVVVGPIKDIMEGVTGLNMYGEKLTTGERIFSLAIGVGEIALTIYGGALVVAASKAGLKTVNYIARSGKVGKYSVKKSSELFLESSKLIEVAYNSANDISRRGLEFIKDFTLDTSGELRIEFREVEKVFDSARKLGINPAKIYTKTIQYSEHALEQAAKRGIPKSWAEKTIQKGQRYFDHQNKSVVHVLQDSLKTGQSLGVARDAESGVVKTIMKMKNFNPEKAVLKGTDKLRYELLQ